MYSLFKRFKRHSRHSSWAFQQQQLFLKVFCWVSMEPFGVVGLPNWDGELWGAKGSTMALQPLGISQPKVSMWSPKKTAAGEEVGSTSGGRIGQGFYENSTHSLFFSIGKNGGCWLIDWWRSRIKYFPLQKKMYAVKHYPHVVTCEESVLHFFLIAASLLFEKERSFRDPTVPQPRRKAIFPTSQLLMASSIETFPTLEHIKDRKRYKHGSKPHKKQQNTYYIHLLDPIFSIIWKNRMNFTKRFTLFLGSHSMDSRKTCFGETCECTPTCTVPYSIRKC